MSPPGGDFSDPVTSATLGIVQVNFRCIPNIMGLCPCLFCINDSLTSFFVLMTHLPLCSGVLGIGQEAGSEETLPLSELAH